MTSRDAFGRTPTGSTRRSDERLSCLTRKTRGYERVRSGRVPTTTTTTTSLFYHLPETRVSRARKNTRRSRLSRLKAHATTSRRRSRCVRRFVIAARSETYQWANASTRGVSTGRRFAKRRARLFFPPPRRRISRRRRRKRTVGRTTRAASIRDARLCSPMGRWCGSMCPRRTKRPPKRPPSVRSETNLPDRTKTRFLEGKIYSASARIRTRGA